MLQTLSAAVAGVGLGLKAYSVTPSGVRFVVLLWDPESGDLLAMMEADRLGVLRTGAASGVASRYMARADARRLAVYGSGHQAFSQIEAVCRVRPIEEVRLYSPTREHREACAEQVQDQLGLRAQAVSEPQEAAAGAQVVTTITKAKEPVLSRSWLSTGVHINAAGSNRRDARELDRETVTGAARIVVDALDQCRHEAGDLLEQDGAGGFLPGLDEERLSELSAVVAGRASGRGSEDEITLFESTGIAVEDVALARIVYDRAVERGRGERLPQTIL